MFNGLIMSLSIMFLPLCVYTAEGLKDIFLDDKSLILERRKDLSELDWTDNNIVTPLCILFSLLMLPFIFYRVLKKYIDRLTEPGLQSKFGMLYAEMSMFERERKISYYSMFLVKRMAFVMIPAMFYMAPWMQL